MKVSCRPEANSTFSSGSPLKSGTGAEVGIMKGRKPNTKTPKEHGNRQPRERLRGLQTRLRTQGCGQDLAANGDPGAGPKSRDNPAGRSLYATEVRSNKKSQFKTLESERCWSTL